MHILARFQSVTDLVGLDFEHTGNISLDYADAQFAFFDFQFFAQPRVRRSPDNVHEFFHILIGKRRPPEWSIVESAAATHALGTCFRAIMRKIEYALLHVDLRWTQPENDRRTAELAQRYGVRFRTASAWRSRMRTQLVDGIG